MPDQDHKDDGSEVPSADAAPAQPPAEATSAEPPAEAASAPADPPRPKKKKRQKKLTSPETPEAKQATVGPIDRAPFLDGFPAHPELDRLVSAFETGNYLLIRQEAKGLAQRSDDPAVRAAALELRRRIDPDPMAKYILLASLLLLVALTIIAYATHAGHTP
jgi:hypothetical protein